MKEIKVDSTVDMEKSIDANMFIVERKNVFRFVKGIFLILGIIMVVIGIMLPNRTFVIMGILFFTSAFVFKKLSRFITTKTLGKSIGSEFESVTTITEEQVSTTGKNGFSVFNWDEIHLVSEDSINVYLFITMVQLLIFRKSEFQNDELNVFWDMIPSSVKVERE